METTRQLSAKPGTTLDPPDSGCNPALFLAFFGMIEAPSRIHTDDLTGRQLIEVASTIPTIFTLGTLPATTF